MISGGGDDPMALGLTIAIVVALAILFVALGLLFYIRRCRNGSAGKGSRSDVHELTPRKSAGGDSDSVDGGASSSVVSVHDEVVERRLEAVKNQIWTIPRNFIDIATEHEPIARGKFGTVLSATVNKQGAISR